MAQKTKFEYVVASFMLEYATEVHNLQLQPPNENPYGVLKEQSVKQTAASEQLRLQQLLNLATENQHNYSDECNSC